MAALRRVRLIAAPLILIGAVVAGCGDDDADDSRASDQSSPSGDASSEASPAPSPTGAEAPVDEAFVDAITNCQRLLLTPRQVRQVLGVQVQPPKPDKAAGLVFGCEYATPNKDQGGGQLVIDASTTENPPPSFSTPTTSIQGVGDKALFNPQPGATTILRVRSGEVILDFSVGGILLYDRFGGQDALAAPLVEIANQALLTLTEDVSPQ